MSKVVIFGGGTGLSNILKGLKTKDLDLTVVVAVSDNGGSTGTIREHYEIPAPGDLRRAVVALSDLKNVDELMNYRFDEKLQNHTIGNLMLTALVGIEGDISSAVKAYCELLDVKECILPITNESVELKAIMDNGDIVTGETQIVDSKHTIKEVFYDESPVVCEDVTTKVSEADLIIFSSGSLYTSIIANILFEDLTKAIRHSAAKKLYVANIMTQHGETEGFNLHKHIDEINKYLKGEVIDYCLLNTNHMIDENIFTKYLKEDASFVVKTHEEENITIIEDDLVYTDSHGHARHDYMKIADYVEQILRREI